MKIDKYWSFHPALHSSAEEEDAQSSSSADESQSAGWKLQYFIYFHRDLSTPAMSMDISQVGVALFPSF